MNSGRSSPQYFTDQHLTLSSTAMYLSISSQFENHTIGFSQSSGLSTIMEFPFSSPLLILLTLLCLLNIGEVSFNVVGLKYLYLSIFKLHKSISLPLPPWYKKKKNKNSRFAVVRANHLQASRLLLSTYRP